MSKEKLYHRAAHNSRELIKLIQHRRDKLPAGDSLCFDGEADGHDLKAIDFEHTTDPIDARTPLIDRIPQSEEIVLFFPKQSAPGIERTD